MPEGEARSVAIEALDALIDLRALVAENRAGASADWVAAAEEAIALAEDEVDRSSPRVVREAEEILRWGSSLGLDHSFPAARPGSRDGERPAASRSGGRRTSGAAGRQPRPPSTRRQVHRIRARRG